MSLAHYAALYSDSMILPVCTGSLLDAKPEIARLALGDLYFKHALLRPLLEAGLARFELDCVYLCDTCAAGFPAIYAKLDKAAFDFYASKLDKIRVIYRPPHANRRYLVEITGPTDYIPHGCLNLDYMTTEAPDWAPKRMQIIDGRPGAYLGASRIKKYKIGEQVFAGLSRDAILQQCNGLRFNGS